MTRSLLVLADRLRGLGVTRVVMEATSVYWKAPFYLLEAAGFEVWLVNAKDVKHLPGRPKTDKLDAVWLCKVAERQMIRPSFVPPPEIRRLRDLTRYRTSLVVARNAEKQRVEKLLEDAQIKLSVAVSDIFGVSGRKMLAALVGGQRDPKVLAEMACGSMRRKIPMLEEAFTGLLHRPSRVPADQDARPGGRLDADIAELDTRIEAEIRPFADQVERLDAIPGIDRTAAQAIIAEIGVDMSRFPTPAHLASWAKFAPGVKESAGKQKGRGATGHGNRYLARTLGNAVAGAGRTQTFLGARYRRLARRRGNKRAVVAVGRSMLVIIWHLLSDPDLEYVDLGADYYELRNTDPARKKREHIRQLEALGYKVSLEPAA